MFAHCDRRDFLRIGGGLALAATGTQLGATPLPSRRAKACILVYLLGGPPQLDTFDLKPNAPIEIRGPFRPTATRLPGLHICEHLPRLASLTDRFALVRSVTYPNHNHTPMIYYTLTGRSVLRPNEDNDVRPPQRDDYPHLGSVLARHLPAPPGLPGYLAIPELAVRSSLSGQFHRVRQLLRGGAGGFLGPLVDPLAVNGDPGMRDAIPALALPREVNETRLDQPRASTGLMPNDAMKGCVPAMIRNLFRFHRPRHPCGAVSFCHSCPGCESVGSCSSMPSTVLCPSSVRVWKPRSRCKRAVSLSSRAVASCGKRYRAVRLIPSRWANSVIDISRLSLNTVTAAASRLTPRKLAIVLPFSIAGPAAVEAATWIAFDAV
jgi:hypothetical protein